jgi:hypothetical protein
VLGHVCPVFNELVYAGIELPTQSRLSTKECSKTINKQCAEHRQRHKKNPGSIKKFLAHTVWTSVHTIAKTHSILHSVRCAYTPVPKNWYLCQRKSPEGESWG